MHSGLVGVVVVSGRVVHIGGQPDGIVDIGALDEGQDVGNLQLPAAGRTVALGDRLDAPIAVDVIDDDEADRHIGRNHLPGRPRIQQFALEPRDLGRTEEVGGGTVGFLLALAVRPAIAAHVQHEYVKQRTLGGLASAPTDYRWGTTPRQIFWASA